MSDVKENKKKNNRVLIKTVIENHDNFLNKEVVIKGWIRSIRKAKKFAFLVINDGSSQANLQAVYDVEKESFEEVSNLLIGSSLKLEGMIVESQGKGQSVEMHANDVHIYSKTTNNYPLQKKASSLEFLREQAHLRPRTNLFSAVFRIRHALAMATHQFFDSRNFYYLNSPIITAVDAEGAGEMFNLSNYNFDKINEIQKDKDGKIDYSNDYFAKKTSLCVTGQLEAECFALGMGAVYTFGPTFRAENSNTARHLSEFWMIEPEIAFYDLDELAVLATDYIKYLIKYVLDNCKLEMQAIDGYHKFSMKGSNQEYISQIKSLENVLKNDFIKISYSKAIEILKESQEKFEFPAVWGDELQTEHERFLVDKYFKGPVIVVDYPKNCKAFYMKQNDDGKTVAAMDILVPGVGEIIGGSQREEDLSKLEHRMEELKMSKEPLWWYLDLRRFGSVEHSGFGLGFERAIKYITGMSNIKDVIAFPRTPKNCDF